MTTVLYWFIVDLTMKVLLSGVAGKFKITKRAHSIPALLLQCTGTDISGEGANRCLARDFSKSHVFFRTDALHLFKGFIKSASGGKTCLQGKGFYCKALQKLFFF
jgi:hypothetical protein